jgi:hypothetical protein
MYRIDRFCISYLNCTEITYNHGMFESPTFVTYFGSLTGIFRYDFHQYRIEISPKKQIELVE